MFGLVDDSAPGVIARNAPAAAGLFVTGCIVWWLRPVPPSEALSWTGLATSAAGHVLLASVTAAVAVASIAGIALPKEKRNIGLNAFRTAVCAIWLALLAVLLSGASLWAVIPAALLALALVSIFRNGNDVPAPALELAGDGDVRALFHISSLRRVEEWRLASLSASILLQAALVSVLMDSPIGAAGFTVFGGAVLMASSGNARAHEPWPIPTPRKVAARSVGMAALAIVITAAGLLRYLAADLLAGQLDGRQGLVAMARALFSPSPFESDTDRSPDDAGKGGPGEKDHSDTNLQVEVSDKSFPGIILLPDEQPFMKVVPVLPSLKAGFYQGAEQDPLGIPFEGVYWYFMWPSNRPPANSIVTRGSPSVRTFRATDLSRLTMKARHNFGSLIGVSCCGAIEVHLTNADRFPGTVSLELVLVNTMQPGSPSQSLGRAEVSSIPQFGGDDRVLAAAKEVLVYPIPRDSKLQQFDEAALRFRLEPQRQELSARMAIERFVLIPGGS